MKTSEIGNSEIREAFLAFIILIAIGILTTWIISPKKVDGYYLSRGGNNSNGVCVYAHWTWHADEQAYCTDRYSDALDFAERANKTVK